MALTAFRVENDRALRLAECGQVPPVMVVAGPNGVGKSTLLYALHRRVGLTMDDGTQIIYQPPHRAIRRQQVQRRWLTGGALRTLGETFADQSVNGFEGLQIPFPSRAPDNVDEAGSVLKVHPRTAGEPSTDRIGDSRGRAECPPGGRQDC